MEPCKHCGRERDMHNGLRETCPELPAQRFEVEQKRPTRTWFCGCVFDYLSSTTTPVCAAHKG